MAFLRFLVVAVLLFMTITASPVPSFFKKKHYEHHIIHVPYHVHTVHHYHKVHAPVYHHAPEPIYHHPEPVHHLPLDFHDHHIPTGWW